MTTDMVTGLPWVPERDFVRDIYNLGRYVDETQAERVKSSTSQGEREAEFNRWFAAELRIVAQRFITEGDSKDAVLAFANRVEIGAVE